MSHYDRKRSATEIHILKVMSENRSPKGLDVFLLVFLGEPWVPTQQGPVSLLIINFYDDAYNVHLSPDTWSVRARI
jgi:hypothetical protein